MPIWGAGGNWSGPPVSIVNPGSAVNNGTLSVGGGGASLASHVATPTGFGSSTSHTSTSCATVGNIFTIDTNIIVTELWVLLFGQNGGHYTLTLAEMSGATGSPSITNILQQESFVVSGTPIKWFVQPIASPVTLTAGNAYGVFVTRTDSTSTTDPAVFYGLNAADTLTGPVYVETYGESATIAPANGTTFTSFSSGGGNLGVGFGWEF